MNSYKISNILFTTLFGCLGSILFGMLFYGMEVFSFSSISFQVLVFGFCGALFFGLFEYGSKKEQYFGFIFILLFNIVIFTGKFLAFKFVVRDFFFLSALFISIKYYNNYIKKYSQLQLFVRSFVLVVSYAIANVIAGSIVYIINVKGSFPTIILLMFFAKSAILIGLGIGIGIDFYSLIQTRLLKMLKTKHG